MAVRGPYNENTDPQKMLINERLELVKSSKKREAEIVDYVRFLSL